MEILQRDLDRLGKWAVENAIRINPSNSKAVRFTTASVKDPLKLFDNGHTNTGSEKL
jgi:hypothetical protein